MSRTPEGRYIDKIHRQINSDIWKIRMQMGMGAPRGIPDFLYRGTLCDLWIEYKVVEDWSKKRTIPWNKISEHQMDWLIKGEALGKKHAHAVVIGDASGKGTFIWASDVINDNFRKKTKPSDLTFSTPKEIALKINYVIML